MQRISLLGNREISSLTDLFVTERSASGDEESKPMTHGREKSDSSIVAVKLANKTGLR
jgi:hypothetical protein